LLRREKDAQALAAKVAAKQALQAQQSAQQPTETATTPIKPKQVAKKNDNLDDLLASGLDAKTKKRAK
jgi:hypothetical protein